MKGWWSSLRGSLGGLRRLSQPCFLPLEAGAGPFALLLAALAIGSALMPDWPVRFLPGVAPGVMALWHGSSAWTLLGLLAVGPHGDV